jgi:phytol kinase
VLATFGALLAIFSIIAPLLQAEVLRKGIHISMGLTTLSFPWLFETAWPVVMVAAASAVAFLALRMRFPLFRRLAAAMTGIKRVSVGEYCFVAATCIVFVLAQDDPVLYCIPILLLTLADSAAALVGTAYGTHRYMTMGYYKTLEGSTAFFLVAFACIAVPLAWFTEASNPESIAVAALIAFAVTVLEAAIGGGFDNLLVPLGAFAAIKATGLTVGQPDALDSGSPLVVAALSVAAALLVLLVAALASWRKTSALGEQARPVRKALRPKPARSRSR